MIATAIRTIARGQHGADNLSMDDAEQVLSSLMQPDANPLQLGAFLIAQRIKGETAAELAGFVRASRKMVPGFAEVGKLDHAVDLPCYAGKRRSAPAQLAAALMLRDQGIKVFVHGVEEVAGRVTAWPLLQQAGVLRADNLTEASEIMKTEGLVYMDLAEICPPLMHLYSLRLQLGVRTFANTVARLLNPIQCAGQLNGVFHPPYVERMVQVNKLLGQPRSLIFMGAEGDPELYTERQKLVVMQQGEQANQLHVPDMGHALYPKEKAEAEEIQTQFTQLLAAEAGESGKARVKRMHAALMWAASGNSSEPWLRSVKK